MESSPRHSHIAKSVQNLLQIVEIYNSSHRSRARSLPNIIIPSSPTSIDDNCCQYRNHNPSDELVLVEPGGSSSAIKKQNQQQQQHPHNHHKILKKTWDKVKTAIIHTTTSHAYRRGSLNKTKLDSSSKALNLQQPCLNSADAVSSAPSSPLHHHNKQQQQIFDFDKTSSRPHSTDFLRSASANAASEMKSQQQENNESDSVLLFTTDKSPSVMEREKKSTSQNIEEESSQKIQQNYAKLQKRLSEELHQRMSEHKPADPKTAIENLSEDFKKRLRQWEMWKLSTGKVTYTDDEIAQILPSEFSQKLHEWESIKTSGVHSHSRGKTPDSLTTSGHHSKKTQETSSPEPSTKNKLLRKKKSSSESSRQKELVWLDKQLEKIEVEKKRLEREMKKYVEREARLEKMKEALQNASSSEIWIRTPTAKCKVEKLTEKFTKKLYQWEEMHGIQPESSTMALLHPKYYGPPPQEDENAEIESRAQAEFNSRRYDDDTPAVSSSRDSESRQDECEDVDDYVDDVEEQERAEGQEDEEGTTEHEDSHHHQQDLHEEHQRISSASSSDFEEATDSFATHEKGNSTDSDFIYRAEFPSSRRRSSEAISTPLSARSPSLSAFTSDDEADTCGLLKTVSEENENNNNTLQKDAESQTEVILKAKPIVVEDDDENNRESFGGDEQQQESSSSCKSGIFVQTKRTIFTPILDESELEKVVVIDGGDSLLLKSPSLIRKAIQQTQLEETRPISPPQRSSPSPELLPCSFSISRMSPTTNPPSPGLKMTHPRPPPPRIVEVTPKIHHHSIPQPQRTFPKMGKIPIYCSPLGTRRHLGTSPTVGSVQSETGVGLLNDDLSISTSPRQHSSSVDFGTDSNYFTTNQPGSSSSSVIPCLTTPSCQISKIPFALRSGAGGRRNTSATTTTIPSEIPEESGIVGASITTGQRHPAFLPVRSSSFRIHRNVENHRTEMQKTGGNKSGKSGGFYAQLRNRVGSTVAKSQSTGSIRTKLEKAFSTFTHKITTKENNQQQPATSSTSSTSQQQGNINSGDTTTHH